MSAHDSWTRFKRLLLSRTLRKVEQREPLSFYDACRFWGISPRSNAEQLQRQIQEIERLMDDVRGAQLADHDQVTAVQQVHLALFQQFDNEIQQILRRDIPPPAVAQSPLRPCRVDTGS